MELTPAHREALLRRSKKANERLADCRFNATDLSGSEDLRCFAEIEYILLLHEIETIEKALINNIIHY